MMALGGVAATGPDGSGEGYTRVRSTAMVLVAVVAGAFALYFGREIFVPIVLAVLLNAIFRPVVRKLEKLGLPTAGAAAMVVLAIVFAFIVAGVSLAPQVQRWVNEAPKYFSAAEEKIKKVRKPFQRVSELAKRIEQVAQPTTGPSREQAGAAAPAQPSVTPTLASRFLGTTARIVTRVIEVLLLLYLLLASGDLFVHKLIKVIPQWQDKEEAVRVIDESHHAIMRYLVVFFFIVLCQGTVVALVMWALKMPSPILWGLFTVGLEFIPYFGAIVMILLLSVTAIATFDGVGHILLVPASYLVISTIQANVVSPFVFGQHLKLNPVAVLVGVMVWWFLWGVPGAFLAVPIIATIKIVADHVDTLKPVGEFLGE